MLFEVDIGEACEHRDCLTRICVGVLHQNDVGLTDRGNLEVAFQAFDGSFHRGGRIGRLLPAVQSARRDDLLEEIVAGEQFDFGVDLRFTNFPAIVRPVVAVRSDDHLRAFIFHQHLHMGFVLLRHGESSGNDAGGHESEGRQDL